MPEFRVVTEELSGAAARVRAREAELAGARGMLGAGSGAADGTPAAGAWESFVSSVDLAAQSAGDAVTGLSGALRTAAGAYQLADQAAANSFGR